MNTFPTTAIPGSVYGFGGDYTDKAVLIGDAASGYPVINKLFTFVPRDFEYELPSVTDAEKAQIDAFYLANMDVPFYWLNPKDKLTYRAIFTAPPKCRPVTTSKWRISCELRQADSETS